MKTFPTALLTSLLAFSFCVPARAVDTLREKKLQWVNKDCAATKTCDLKSRHRERNASGFMADR